MSISTAVSGLPNKNRGSLRLILRFHVLLKTKLVKQYAKPLVENGIKYVVEGANMPLTAEAIDYIRSHRVHYAPGKAANAGGVSVSALEMSKIQSVSIKPLSKLMSA